ncbi:MAG: carboxypeptidase regulatory-like domain-containing protein [Bryobacteraceae bacterium]|nr:carboxypeptidase regulatory-like domain-containing protein [Bryobacteraceae bacterium]
MKQRARRFLAIPLAVWLAIQPVWGNPAGEPAILQIRVIEGEGAVHIAGSSSSRVLLVQITDETGRPVSGAAVSFRLPEDGPTGSLSSGLKTEITISGADGRAALQGVRWNQAVGQTQIRVTAAKGQARAGILVSQYVSEPSAKEALSARNRSDAAVEIRTLPEKGSSRLKWIALTLLIAGAGGGAAALLSRSSGGTGGPGAVPPPASSAPPVVGAPSIIVGKP